MASDKKPSLIEILVRPTSKDYNGYDKPPVYAAVNRKNTFFINSHVKEALAYKPHKPIQWEGFRTKGVTVIEFNHRYINPYADSKTPVSEALFDSLTSDVSEVIWYCEKKSKLLPCDNNSPIDLVVYDSTNSEISASIKTFWLFSHISIDDKPHPVKFTLKEVIKSELRRQKDKYNDLKQLKEYYDKYGKGVAKRLIKEERGVLVDEELNRLDKDIKTLSRMRVIGTEGKYSP